MSFLLQVSLLFFPFLCPRFLWSVSRKEVFQPHLPVRLPCYDLAPVIGLALGRSCDGHELQALPTPMA